MMSALAGKMFLRPAIQYSPALNSYHLADNAISGSGPDIAADLLYVSSHGWLGGFMGGDDLVVGRDVYWVSKYFVVGRASAAGLGFQGPRWIILAQCSTVNSATWPLWAKVLGNSDPHVRGILAHEESAPAVGEASRVARAFVGKLRAGVPFLRAWIETNDAHSRSWAAIVHEEATGDRLADFPRFQPFRNIKTGVSWGPYKGYLASERKGVRITDAPPPFELAVYRSHAGLQYRVEPDNLETHALLRDGDQYTFAIAAPANEQLKSLRLELIHIRPRYPRKFAWSQVFSDIRHLPGISVRGFGTGILQVELAPAVPRTWIAMRAVRLAESGLEAHHSYLWVRCSIWLRSGRQLDYDFKTTGLLYS
jgi:hypothetical protein